ncbi:hypothetical protein ETI01_02285 [Macrococcoides caseolyticum]|uniref:hypothetical protein n=1 Tax=Macrococcoides caseolyticum TaxID=69966 RepID=UPI00105B730E|nr:hypothetical protein [Macrococcus caseolyticus]TDM25924.1 hypothetical protein ETI01_02285 [Macrococcus caseolyticus]
MTNELNDIINEAGIIDAPINDVLLQLNNIQPMAKAQTFTQTVKERAEAFKNEYKDTYTPQALKEGIQAIYDEEKAKVEQSIQSENESFQAKRIKAIEHARQQLAKSEDLSSDEITKRVYHTQNMQSDLSLELMTADTGSSISAILSEKMEKATRDKMTARALLSSLHLFTSKIEGLPDSDRAYLLTRLKMNRDELSKLVNGTKNEAYKQLVEQLEKQDTNVYGADLLSINMNPNIERYL